MSNYRAYIINFDKGGFLDTFDYKGLHKSVKNADGIISWWHYLSSSYIIVTGLYTEASDVGVYVRQIMPKKRFVVLEVDLSNHDGWLPDEAYNWMKKYM